MRTYARKRGASKRNDSAKSWASGPTSFLEDGHARPISQLSQTIGNQAVLRLLSSKSESLEAGPPSSAATGPSHDTSRAPASVGGRHEQEAGRLAEELVKITRMQAQPARGNRYSSRHSSQLDPNQTRSREKRPATSDVGQIPMPPLMHEIFGQHLEDVRIHADAGAAESARAVQASAYTVGNDIVFAAGRYSPHSVQGLRLLSHELAHVVQQQGGMSNPPAGIPSLSAAPVAPQHDDDIAALRARLAAVRARLRVLRAATTGSLDVGGTLAEVQSASQREIERNVRTQTIQQHGARQTFPHSGVAAVVRRVASASQAGNVVTVSFPIPVTYLSLSETDAQRRASTDLGNIRNTIRDIWQVDIQSGEYAGLQFRVNPTVTYLRRGASRDPSAFLIQVRGPDTGPSSGDGATGIISLAIAHLARVSVVAHELTHLFGFTDTYLRAGRNARGQTTGRAVVGRQENPNQADLLGLIDPVVLERWRREGSITPQQVARQSGPVHIWEGEASQVLRILGVHPPPPPTPSSEAFDPSEELDRVRREGEARLAATRRQRQRTEESVQWLRRVEEIMRLEREERSLRQRIHATQTP